MFRCCAPHIPPSSSFSFNDTATTEIYTLSLHDGSSDLKHSLKFGGDIRYIQVNERNTYTPNGWFEFDGGETGSDFAEDRKSTRLNSSHVEISYAVFCLKKKKN